MKNIFLTLSVLVFSFGFSQTNVFDIARKGTFQDMEFLHKTNPDAINQVNEGGNSPLILACYKGNVEVATFLIKNVKDINFNSPMGTALMAATVKGNVDLVKLLLESKANINATDGNGITSLIYAVQFQNHEMVKILVEHKADKNIKNKEGKTAFEFAVFSGNQTIINQLKNI